MSGKITIAAVGDIFLGRGVENTMVKRGKNYIFDLVRPILTQHDIVIGNLESPVTDMQTTAGFEHLVARPSALDELSHSGISAVTLANNHIMDYGLTGLRDTVDELRNRQIGLAGTGLNEYEAAKPLTGINGKNVTLLSYYGMGKGGNVSHSSNAVMSSGAYGENGGHNSGQLSKILRDIESVKDKSDVVLVSLHWGHVGKSKPMKYQVEFAHQLIDHGAHGVLGTGPHTLQPVEQYHGGIIAYSLGNFVFDHHDRRESMILHLTFERGSLEDVSITPILISSENRPEPITSHTHPDLYAYTKSLLVSKLDSYESDAEIISHLSIKALTPKNVLKKLIWRQHGVYPLSFYIHAMVELVKNKLFQNLTR